MMGMERIKAKILEDSENKAGQILEQARQQAEEIKNDALKESESIRAKILEDAEVDGKEYIGVCYQQQRLKDGKNYLRLNRKW